MSAASLMKSALVILIKLLSAVTKTVLFLLSFFLLTALIGYVFYQPEPEPIDETNLPHYYPLVIFLLGEDSDHQCRAIWYRQIEDLEASELTYTFQPTEAADSSCDHSVQYLKQNKRWPVMLQDEEDLSWPYANIEVAPGPEGTSEIRVRYASDDDYHNEALYWIQEGKITSANHSFYFGPGKGIMAMPFALAINVILWIMFAWYRRRRIK